MQMVRVVVLEDLEDIAGGMGAVAPLQVKALEAGHQGVEYLPVLGIIQEVVRRLAVFQKGATCIIFMARQGQFMEIFFYYPCWAVRVGVVDGLRVALVVAARS